MGFWTNKRVVVTGGSGFLGGAVVEQLLARGCTSPTIPRSREYDLVREDAVRRLFDQAQPELVIHLAARVGGIGANQTNPGSFFYANLMMGAHIIEEARLRGVEKVVIAGTVCAYPKFAPVPFHEDDLWNGYPEETNAPYGIAKKALLVQAQAYRQQYGLDSIYLLPVNLYGPRDNFDLSTSHVIPALIRKCIEAQETGQPSIPVWGSGRATREFLYVDDCAAGIVDAAERYNGAEPVNLGSGQETSIRELAEKIAKLSGFTGTLEWDATKPDGQPRRRLDTSRARREFGFEAHTALDQGLATTIEWYRGSR
jgi:GDP-L-fucose synthase